MALVRKEAGKSQGEVSRGVMPPLEDGSRFILPPKNWGRAGQAEGLEVFGRHPKPARGLGVGVRESDLTFAHPHEMTSPLPSRPQPQEALSDLHSSLPCPSQDGTPASSCLP